MVMEILKLTDKRLKSNETKEFTPFYRTYVSKLQNTQRMTFLAHGQRVNTTFGKEVMQRLKARVKWELLTEDM
jgi:hypothetical protein